MYISTLLLIYRAEGNSFAYMIDDSHTQTYQRFKGLLDNDTLYLPCGLVQVQVQVQVQKRFYCQCTYMRIHIQKQKEKEPAELKVQSY